jgi:hypothetical protein
LELVAAVEQGAVLGAEAGQDAAQTLSKGGCGHSGPWSGLLFDELG